MTESLQNERNLEFTILGSGSSGGVPRADGDWGACDPNEPRNRRSRCSLLVKAKTVLNQIDNTTILIDTSPDFREQSLSARITRLDAVLYTHDHADQAHGIDDLRAFFLKGGRKTPCYMDAVTRATLFQRFGYIFAEHAGYPAICEARDLPAHGLTWSIKGPSGAIPIVTFDQDHGSVRSVGYRFANVAYSSDVVHLPPQSLEALQGLDVFIVDALRYTPHPTHANLEKALGWIDLLKPRRAILTNLHQDMDHATLKTHLPPHIEPAYDGMTFMSPISDF